MEWPPDYLTNNITMEIEMRKNVNTRTHDMNVHIPFPNSETENSLLFRRNDSPGNIKEITNIDGFKKQLKRNVHI